MLAHKRTFIVCAWKVSRSMFATTSDKAKLRVTYIHVHVHQCTKTIHTKKVLLTDNVPIGIRVIKTISDTFNLDW